MLQLNQDFLHFNAELNSRQPHKTTHSEWVEQDAAKHKKWAKEDDQAWAENFMDEMDDRGLW